MTIEEAIKHADEVARNGCSNCSQEHRQLADWLRELVKLRKEKNEKKYEYSVKYTHLPSGVSFISNEKFDNKGDAIARALHEKDVETVIVRRSVGEWEVVPNEG
ncbi:MAG: hypothetical protein MJZ81_10835 [Bacteroidales bacterium]|nr:hypothetical protein [Bacteroidales bacterium]